MWGDLIIPTLAVVLTWGIALVLLAGSGYAVRLGLERATGLRGRDGMCSPDVWIGFAALIAYVQLWSLVSGVRWSALLPPAAVAVFGLARASRLVARPGGIPRALLPSAVAGVAGFLVVWLANQALGPPRAYDTGLYHLGAIGYVRSFGTVPGLANLNSRFGADDPHFLYVALVDGSPWGFAGFHLANGLLVALLVADVAFRLARRRAEQLRALPFTRVASILSIPAVLATALGEPFGRLSSPSIDLPVLVLFAVGTLYIVETLEAGFEPTAAMAGMAMLTTAAANRSLYGPATLIAIGLVVRGAVPNGGRLASRLVVRSALLTAVVPLLIACGWAARQAVLSGLPFYPTKLAALPVDWTLPRASIDDLTRLISSWARVPRQPPDKVLGSWHWLKPWLRTHAESLNTLGPTAFLLAVVPPAAILHRLTGTRLRERGRPLVAALAVCLVTLAIWFFTAPDPRFVYGPLWFTAIALLAAIVPADVRSITLSVREAGAAGAVAVSVLAVLVVNVIHSKAYSPVHATGSGALGSFDPPQSTLTTYSTRSGLALRHPVGDDRCWRALDCTPAVNLLVRQRGSHRGDGFAPIRARRSG